MGKDDVYSQWHHLILIANVMEFYKKVIVETARSEIVVVLLQIELCYYIYQGQWDGTSEDCNFQKFECERLPFSPKLRRVTQPILNITSPLCARRVTMLESRYKIFYFQKNSMN